MRLLNKSRFGPTDEPGKIKIFYFSSRFSGFSEISGFSRLQIFQDFCWFTTPHPHPLALRQTTHLPVPMSSDHSGRRGDSLPPNKRKHPLESLTQRFQIWVDTQGSDSKSGDRLLGLKSRGRYWPQVAPTRGLLGAIWIQ